MSVHVSPPFEGFAPHVRAGEASSAYAVGAAEREPAPPAGPETLSLSLGDMDVVIAISPHSARSEASGGAETIHFQVAGLDVRLAVVTAQPAKQEMVPAQASQATKSGLPKWRLKRVLAHVEAHLGEAVTLADMAEVAGLSRMHFASQFRIATGQRPHEFLLQRRIERAQEMLRETRDSVVEIALAVGFQTQAHFTTVFRRFVGDTPYRWRCANASER